MKPVLLTLGFAVLLPTLRAQDPELPKGPSAEAQAAYDKLEKEAQKYTSDWRKKQVEALKDPNRDKRKPIAMAPDMGPYIKRFQAQADRRAGSEDAVPFLTWLALRAGNKDAIKAAATTLMEQHLKSPGLVEFAQAVPGITRFTKVADARDWLDRLVEENPSLEVKASALFARALPVVRSAAIGSAVYQAAKEDLRRAAKLSTNERLSSRALAAITEREKLGEGMLAPEIEGKDLDEVAFKLSDYRGKVVMLDFWGHW